MIKLSKKQLTRMMNSAVGRLPRLIHGPAFDAVFDPFEFEGKEYFYKYNSSLKSWKIQRTLDPAERVVPDTSGRSPDVAEALTALAFMPPPREPDALHSAGETMLCRSFWYRDLHFGWMRFPGGVWEIAVCNNTPEELLAMADEA